MRKTIIKASLPIEAEKIYQHIKTNSNQNAETFKQKLIDTSPKVGENQ